METVQISIHAESDKFKVYKGNGELALIASQALGQFISTKEFFEIFGINASCQETDRVTLSVPSAIAHTPIREIASREALNGTVFSVEALLGPYLHAAPELPLFPFQLRGVEFLVGSPRRILADDMGLGKSLQAIAAIGHLLRGGQINRALVICPKTLVFNWLSEFNKWDPALAVNVLLPKRIASDQIWKSRFSRSHVVITSYDHFRENSSSVPKELDLVVVDEAHRVRNLASQVSQALAIREPQRSWFLSGTPVERDAEDLASLLSLLEPKRFSVSNAKLQLPVLRRLATGYLLRRAKSDVLAELPLHTEITEIVQLTPRQLRAYREISMTKYDNFLEKFSKLRSICDLDVEAKESGKIERMIEVLSDIRTSQERAIVFSFWTEPLRELRHRLTEKGWTGIYEIRADLSSIERAQEIDGFKSDGLVLLASGRIGAEGLTLNEANHVLFLNRWWNPSANAQAVDRVRRIGQDKPTFSYNFISAGTVEEHISSLLADKEMTIDTLIEKLREVGAI